MPDYSRARIYKIVCDTSGEVYYGSTTNQYLCNRLAGHKFDAGRSNCTSKQIIDRGNYSIVLVEEYPCENKEQLGRRERYYIENNECVNKNIPTRTDKEWCEANKDYIKEYNKQQNQANKERIKEWFNVNKVRRKEWCDANRERIAKKAREYYEANRERINEYQRKYKAKKKADALEQQL